jgi:tetratricopeptide (TPR) repeat protein
VQLAHADVDLVATVATKKPRAELSSPLVAAAAKAVKAKDYAKAIPLLEALVIARGPTSPEMKQLADAWTEAGQVRRAAEVWQRIADAAVPGTDRNGAIEQAKLLNTKYDPLADKLELAELAPEAKAMFAAGRAAFAKQDYGDALVLFHMGYALAPDLPGFLRELGATYDKLGGTAPKREFYRRYLVNRPFGGNSEAIRAELGKDTLGTLTMTSSLPCTEIWLNREKVKKLPDKGFVVAPGEYKGLCFNPKYEMALFEYATVEAGKTATMAFRWAVVENQLERPYGRIALENPKAPGVMIDLGITSPEIGVAVASDGHSLKMILKDDSGIRTETRTVRIEAGQHLIVKW